MNEKKHSKANVIFFHPYFSNGGVERTNIGLARELIKRKFSVIFITICSTTHFIDEIRDIGIEFVELTAKSTIKAQIPLATWIRRRRRECQKIVVISCQYYVNLLTISFRPLWGRNVKLILSERNHYDEFQLNQHGWKQKVITMLVPILYKYADGIIANSKELADDLSQWVGVDVKVVYNPTINDRLFNLADQELKEDWFLMLERPVIIGVGRLSKQKGFDILIRAFNKYSHTGYGTLVILGEGDERSNLEKLINYNEKEKVRLPGFIENPYKFIKNSDLFILSSRYEGLPNVLIEALALKTKILSTNCRSGPKEILIGNLSKKIVTVDNVNMLANAMRIELEIEGKKDYDTEELSNSLERFKPNNVGNEFTEILSQYVDRVNT